MNQLKRYTIIGILFVLVTGTLDHFLYDWTEQNRIVGFFAPVNESTWEHMKLAFFPMLLYAIFLASKLKGQYPCIVSALALGILLGTWMIPVIFYTYSGILGFHFLAFDLLTFLLAVIGGFCTIYRFTLSCKAPGATPILFALIFVMILCFAVFTYHAPEIGLFVEPQAARHYTKLSEA